METNDQINDHPSVEKIPLNHKKFFMIDPHEITNGLPYDMRVSAHKKWATAQSLIEHAGGDVNTIRGANEAGGTRETFTRDRYALINGIAHLPDSKAYSKLAIAAGESPHDAMAMAESYEAEIQQTKAFLESEGVPTQKVDGAWFEGGNVIIDDKTKTIFMGLETDRDNNHSLKKLVDSVNETSLSKYTAIGVPLVNQGIYYHLDLGMSDPLPKNHEIMLSPSLTDASTIEIIQKRVGKDRVIMLDEDEPVGTTNLVSPSGNNLVMTTASPERMKDLTQRGYNIIQDPAMIDLTLAAGGVRCMTNEIPVSENTLPKLGR